MSGMKLKKEFVQNENWQLLMEILTIKNKLSELNVKRGPAHPDYISLSIKLDLLTKQYIEEKIFDLISNHKNEQVEMLKKREFSITTKKVEDKWIHSNSPFQQSFILYNRK